MITSTSRTLLPALPHNLGTSELMPPLGAFLSFVRLVIYMSDSSKNTLPNSISTADLQKLADAAKEAGSNQEAEEEKTYSGLTIDELWDVADEGLTLIQEKCPHPLGHKVAAIIVMGNMLNWHNKMAEGMMEDSEFKPAASWLKDAGKFQAIMNILQTIEIGDDDPTVV